MNKRRVTTKKGFTLIELLVVIAIIAILAAILFPVFARARENARRASCQSNLKQIGLGLMQYTQDYDERYPRFGEDPNLSAGRTTPNWTQTIQPYIKSTQLFRCPSNTSNTSTKARADTYEGIAYPLINRSYGMNRNAPNNEGTVASPATKIYVSESIAEWDLAPQGSVGELGSRHWAGHLSTANYLYFDGHVKSLSPTRTGAPLNQWGRAAGQTCPGFDTSLDNFINCDTPHPGLQTELAQAADRYK
jgi:prepilin-type N-terminal cleavage/methylation domain-containing protein/prepilin-type processing-associated H-X9-DG protein